MGNTEKDAVRDEQTFAIIGAAMEVHRELGPGFLESVYKQALEVELRARDIPYQREVTLTISYKRQPLRQRFVRTLSAMATSLWK